MGTTIRSEATLAVNGGSVTLPLSQTPNSILLYTDASGKLLWKERSIPFSGPVLIWVPAAVGGILELTGDDRICRSFTFSEERLSAFSALAASRGNPVHAQAPRLFHADSSATALFALVCDAAHEDGADEYASLLLLALLSRLIPVVQASSQASASNVHQKELIQNVMLTVRQNLFEKLSLEDIAHTLYVNPSYLCSLFRRMTGITFRQYVNKCRIEEAKRLLVETNELVDDIASATGFGSTSYFITVFREQYGTTPNSYRNQQRRQRGAKGINNL